MKDTCWSAARRPLPVGSTLDAATGRFDWQPGVGFLGTYQLLFVRTAPDGIGADPRRSRAAAAASQQLGRADGDRSAGDRRASTRSLSFAGWAIDRGAEAGTGVDALHVWAYQHPGLWYAAVFFGAATWRVGADVGAYFGDRFANAGYALVVHALGARHLRSRGLPA